MAEKKKLLLQLDPDAQPSSFDRIVAYDGGADEVLSHGKVLPEQVRDLVHGAIFTRGPKDLANTAIFIGGKDFAAGEALMLEARKHLLPKFGLTVSIMLDANGANTTAAAAVRCAARHGSLNGIHAGVVGAGPVGQQLALLLSHQGAVVHLADLQASRAESVRQRIRERLPRAQVHTALEADTEMLDGVELLFAAGPTGKELLPEAAWKAAQKLSVLVDLNAVPPAGLAGVDPRDDAKERCGKICYGALAVGNLKMKVHKGAIAVLFMKNDLILEAEALLDLALKLT